VPTDTVLTERRGQIGLVTLNRPQARNAINHELSHAFVQAVASLQDLRCIVVTGADPAFCAGLDLKNLGAPEGKGIGGYAFALQTSEIPLIAAVNGAAVTGGFEIALGCDFIVASERAVFADTHVRVGVYPGPVLVDLPRRIGAARAREMSMTGNFVDAQTALRIGLANHVVPHAEVVPFALRLAENIADADPQMIKTMRKDWDASLDTPLHEARRIHAEFAGKGGFSAPLSEHLASRREAVLARSRDQRGKT